MSDFRDRLRRAIDHSGKPAYKVAEDAKIDKSHLSRVLSGTRSTRLGVDVVYRLAVDATGVSAPWLAFGQGPMVANDPPVSRTSLEVAVDYLRDVLSPQAVKLVREWAAANPDTDLTPRAWGAKLARVQRQLLLSAENLVDPEVSS